jgi:CHAT domain-containing protein
MARRRVRTCLFAFVLAGLIGASPRGQSLVPADQQAGVTAFLEKYYAAYAAKDAEALAALWDPASPDRRLAVNGFRTLFQFQDYAFSNLRVSSLRGDGPSAVAARVLVDAAVTNTAVKRTDAQRWMRTVVLHRAGDQWLLWRDVSAADQLVAELLEIDGLDGRLARLGQERDLAEEDVRQVLDREATRAFAARDNARALALNELAARLAERAGNNEALGQSSVNIGFVYQAQMDHRGALASFEKALAAFEAAGNADRVPATEMNVASSLYAIRDYARAGDYYERALAGFERLGEVAWVPTLQHNLGNVAYLLGNWDAALDHYRKAVEALRAAGPAPNDPGGQARAIASAQRAIGMVFKEQGDYPSALEAYGQALELFESVNDGSATVQTYEALGFVYRLQGDYAGSLQRYFAAWNASQQLLPPLRDPQVEANLLAEIGDVYGLEERYATALDYLQRSLVLQEKVKSQEGIAAVEGGIGGMHFLLGRYDTALAHYRRALGIRQALEQPRNAARLLAHIGLVQVAEDEPDEALASYDQSLDAANGAGDRAGAAIALVLTASVHLAAGRADEGLVFAERGLALAADAGDLDILAHVQMVVGDLCAAREDWDRARRSLGDAIASLEQLRAAGLPSDGRFFNDGVAPHMSMVRLLLQQDRRDEAFLSLERAHQVRLRELLDGGDVVVKGMTAGEQQQERTLRKRAVSLRTQLRKASEQARPDAAKVASLSGQVDEATAARDAFEQALFEAHPDLRALRARADPAPWSEAAEPVVDARTALVAYAVTEARTYGFVVTRPQPGAAAPATAKGDAPARPAPLSLGVFAAEIKPADLGRRIAEFRQKIVQRDPGVGPLARDLYDLLVSGAEPFMAGKTRLLVVPDAALWALPFQALQRADGRYLLEDRAVAYGSSLAALAASARRDRQTRAAPPARLLAVGLSDPGKAAFDRLALLRPDITFAPLPEAEREARALGSFFGPLRAKLLLGREAGRERLRDEAKSAGVLHLALRGVLNDASPLHSLLAAAPATGAGQGLIEAADVLDWDLDVRAVVLSRLESEATLTSAGAGAVTLAWALFVSGAPTAVMSQWIVDAPSTAALALALHRGLRAAAGQPPARPSEALRRAALPLLQGPTRHPFYWAGFTVMGDAR